MIRISLATRTFGLLNLVSARNAGLEPGLNTPVRKDILITADHLPSGRPARDFRGVKLLGKEWDEVVEIRELIGDKNPFELHVEDEQVEATNKLFRRALGIGLEEDVILAGERAGEAPFGTLAQIFPNADIILLSQGLSGYGPPQNPLPPQILERISGYVYLDIVPGLQSVPLSMLNIRKSKVPMRFLRLALHKATADSVAELARLEAEQGRNSALMAGQGLSRYPLLSQAEEIEAMTALAQKCVDKGVARVLYRPHPHETGEYLDALQGAMSDAGIHFSITNTGMPFETLAGAIRPAMVASLFSTALATVNRLYSIPAVSVDLAKLVKHVPKELDYLRTPMLLVSKMTDERWPKELSAQTLLEANAACHFPDRYPHLAPVLEAVRAACPAELVEAFF
ncbi:MAG: alpha-2,8-polysialyltransferase family protein [Propionibacteriaceae bacterium]|jgi:hypothetical protein|nr:alpha-2,8-polysialyltransferase family protein [Propionibacteriaceae bacterium]